MPWFESGDGARRVHVLPQYADTITRLRTEGWREVEAPAEPVPVPVPAAAEGAEEAEKAPKSAKR